MATFPRSKDGMIEYFEERLSKWQLDPAAVGLTAEQVEAFAAFVADARTSYTTVQQGKQNLRNMVLTQDTDIDTMMGLGSALLAIIRAFADATGVTEGNAAAARSLLRPTSRPRMRVPPRPHRHPRQTYKPRCSTPAASSSPGTAPPPTAPSIRSGGAPTPKPHLPTSPPAANASTKTGPSPPARPRSSTFLRTIRNNLVSDDADPITVRLGVPLDQSNTEAGNTRLGIAA